MIDYLIAILFICWAVYEIVDTIAKEVKESRLKND